LCTCLEKSSIESKSTCQKRKHVHLLMHAACERRCNRKGDNQKGGLTAEDAPVDQSGAIEQRDSPTNTRSNVHQRYDEITQAHQASKETNRVGACSAQRWDAHLETTEDKTMHVRHNVRRGGRGHEVMSSFSVDCGESLFLKLPVNCQRPAPFGLKKEVRTRNVDHRGCKTVSGDPDTKPISVTRDPLGSRPFGSKPFGSRPLGDNPPLTQGYKRLGFFSKPTSPYSYEIAAKAP
jgi:hypothetical protein